jgi:hypothetical protein
MSEKHVVMVGKEELECMLWERHQVRAGNVFRGDLTNSLTVSDKLAAAVAVGALAVVSDVLQRFPGYPRHATLGDLLLNAITLKYTPTFGVILQHALDSVQYMEEALKNCWRAAIEQGRLEIVREVARILGANMFGSTHKKIIKSCINLAVIRKNVEVLKAVLAFGRVRLHPSQPELITQRTTTHICNTKETELITAVLRDGRLAPQTSWRNATPMVVAVQSGNLDVGAAVLDFGADVLFKSQKSCPSHGANLTPLQTAWSMEKSMKKLSMVELLCERGAEFPIHA